MNNIEKLKTTGLFTNYIYKAIPLAFDESMSYYETLCGLLAYLKDTVIPTVNNNADAVIELQNLYTQLKNFVDNYFDNLDVQEEINNKLDEMVEDGSLTNLIKAYVDPIYEDFEEDINEEINAFKNETNLRLDNIDAKVDGATSGSPLVASNISEMTDTTRIYVNTTNGHWYWYDGDSWEDGGVYQATVENYDKSLKLNNAIPNSETVGNYINNIENNLLNKTNKIIPITSIIDNKYYNSNNILNDSNDYEAISFDLTNVKGHEIEVSTNIDANAVSLLVCENSADNIIFSNTGKFTVMIPNNATYLNISNKKSSGNFYINIINKENTDIIYTKIQKIVKDYTYWKNLIVSTKANFNGRTFVYFNELTTKKGYLKIKIESQNNNLLKLIRLSTTGEILDTYVANIKEGLNEIKTPLYFNEGEYIAFQIFSTCLKYTSQIQRTFKQITGVLYSTYKGNTLDLSNPITINNSFIIDYQLIDKEDYYFNEVLKESCDLSSIMKNNPNLKIKIIGDSITYGYGIGTSNSWAGLFISYFTSLYPNMTIKNVAQSGRNSTWVVDNIATLINDSDDIVMLMIGTNNRGQVGFGNLYNDLSIIKEYCDERSIKLIIINPPISAINGENGEALPDRIHHMDEISHIIASWCNNHNMDYIDTYENIYDILLMSGKTIDNYFIDGLHPTVEMSYFIFRIVCKGINMYTKIKNATW